jgi:voltage-gated potassium channel
MSFIYFSIITFLTVGYGDIIPLTNFSRLLVCIEVIFGFILIIYGISSFSLMYQSYKVNSPFEVTQVKDGDDDENGSPDSCKMNSHLKSN